MKMYFVKATYTDGIYKLSDFYVGNTYKQVVSKMQDINLEANDGAASTTVNTLLPDGSRVNDYSHVLVPDVNKIYEIDRCVYVNNQQTQIQLIEDSFIGNYQAVKSKKIRLERTNDIELFKGIHDIEDITIRPTIETLGTGVTYTGQWVVYALDAESIMNYEGEKNDKAEDKGVYMKVADFKADPVANSPTTALAPYDRYISNTNYPEVTTNNPLAYNYFNKVLTTDGNEFKVSVYHSGRIRWMENTFFIPDTKLYVNTLMLKSVAAALAPDVNTVLIAFPIESRLSAKSAVGTEVLLPMNKYMSFPPEIKIRDVKIVNESQIFNRTVTVQERSVPSGYWLSKNNKTTYNKTIFGQMCSELYTRSEVGGAVEYNQYNAFDTIDDGYKNLSVLVLPGYNVDLELNTPVSNDIFQYEPFKKYKVVIFGKEYVVAKKNLASLRIRFAPSMSQIEYFGYINNDLSQKLFSDSYSTGIKWSMDQLDLFNQQNPTYKDQFTANMWRKGLNSFTNIGTGVVKGSLKGGAVGATAGGIVAGATSVMNIGFDLHSEKLREKGLDLAPDQIFGDGSNIGLAGQTKYGVFVNTYTSDFEDLMKTKYFISGFPTTKVTSIDTLSRADSDLFGMNKLIKGQLLETVRNKYTTNEINRKLQEGVILI